MIPSDIGLQLYTVRDSLQTDFERTLERVAAIGYRELEFVGYYGRPADGIVRLLDSLGLRAPSRHIGLEELELLDPALEAAETLGHQYLFVWLPDVIDRSLNDFRSFAARLNRAGAIAAKAGVKIGYHNHDFEFRAIDGLVPYDVLLTECDPTLVEFEMDLYWITKAGADPFAYFARWPGRFKLAHVKDSAGLPDHRMADVGAGMIEWSRMFDGCARAGIEHYFVERDDPEDGIASAAASFAFLERLKF